MKAHIFIALGAAALISTGLHAQSAYDAYSLSPYQLRGTARFIGMGGAFTSLGSDLSAMTQNPGGLGLYRSSDIGLTFDISPRSYKATTNTGVSKDSQTKAYFDNIGYVGVMKFNGFFSSLQWGVSYNRIATFDRITSGYANPANGSLTNYIAAYTDGVDSADLLDSGDSYDPYFDSDQDWLSVLAYNSFLINNNGSNTSYAGLAQQGSRGDALFRQREHGYVDEYNIDLACNLGDILYLGIGVGIYDLSKTVDSYYSESHEGALVYEQTDQNNGRLTTGNAGFDLTNRQDITGSGANFKFGFVVQPTDMLRIGAAIHTPTYLHLSHSGYGDVQYNYTPDGTTNTNSGNAWTPTYDYNSRLNTPWRFMVGASLTIAGKAIVSLDYERVAYDAMKLKEAAYDYGYGYGVEYIDNKYANQDIKNYFKGSNIVRAGIEFRPISSLALRAGYNWQGSAVKSNVYNGGAEIYTSGTTPAYSFDGDTQNITLGLGYRYKMWYIDLAYQHTLQKGVYKAYTPYAGNTDTPGASLSRTYNNIVISTGIRF